MMLAVIFEPVGREATPSWAERVAARGVAHGADQLASYCGRDGHTAQGLRFALGEHEVH